MPQLLWPRLCRHNHSISSIKPVGRDGLFWACFEDPECAIATEFVRFAAYNKRHSFSCFQRCIDQLLGLIDPDLEVAAPPLNGEAKASPARRQVWIDC